MKITMTAAGGKAFVLADDASGATVQDGFRPKQTRILQSQALFRAAYKANLARFNLENRLTFRGGTGFCDGGSAPELHRAARGPGAGAGTLTLYNRSGTGQASADAGERGGGEMECVEHVGVSCKFQYTMAGNGAWE